MKRWFGIIVCIVLGYLLQTTVMQEIRIAGVAPSLLIILLVAISYRYGRMQGMLAGFIIGLFVDLLDGSFLGLYALIYMILGYFLGLSNKIYYQDDTTIPIFLVSAGDFAFNFFIYVAGFLLRNRLHFLFYLRTIILPEMLYTVVISVFLYRFIHKLFCLLDRKRMEEL